MQNGPFEPSDFRELDTGNVVQAMRLEDDASAWHAVYLWVEENTDGSFDINDRNTVPPRNGVSIDAANGELIIAAPHGLLTAILGDYVIKKNRNGEIYFEIAVTDYFQRTHRPIF